MGLDRAIRLVITRYTPPVPAGSDVQAQLAKATNAEARGASTSPLRGSRQTRYSA